MSEKHDVILILNLKNMSGQTINRIPKIRSFLLWDIELKDFDYIENKRFVIERVCSLGNFDDFNEIARYYGIETIKNEIVKSTELDKKSLNFFSHYFKIPENKFKCYSKKAFLFQP